MSKQCNQMTHEQRVQVMADAIWAGNQWRNPGTPGVCKYCECILPYLYHVSSAGKVHDVARGSKMEARAVEILHSTTPQDAMVFPSILCEVMGELGIHSAALQEIKYRRDRWHKAAAAKAKPAKQDLTGVGGHTWT